MWRNTDVQALVDWLHERNGGIAEMDRRAGFYGLDIYNMWGSIGAVLDYLDRVDPDAAKIAARTLRLPHALAEGSRHLRSGPR